MRKVKIILFVITCTICSCTFPSQSKNEIYFNEILDSIPMEKLPFSINSDIFENSDSDTHLNVFFNKLFSDSTILNPPFLYSNSTNLLPGTFFRKLESKGNFTILLFSYFDEAWGSDGMSKTITVELQMFDSDQKLLDKMVVYAGIEGTNSWKRTFSIDKDYVITLNNHFICNEEEFSEKRDITILKHYLITDQGKIVDYYLNENGIVEECLCVPFADLCWYEKGDVRNHKKQGKWIDYEFAYNEFNELLGVYVWNNYSDGIKMGGSEIIDDRDLEDIECLSN